MSSVVIKIDAEQAFREIGKLDKAVAKFAKGLTQFKRKDGGNKTFDAIPDRIKAKLNAATINTVLDTYEDLIISSPVDSYWFVSNWAYSQGGMPATDSIQTPERGAYRRGQMFDAPPAIAISGINPYLPQYIYNNTSYATDIALGGLVNDVPADWFTSIVQPIVDGSVFRERLRKSGRGIRLPGLGYGL